jgi:hypothetical protein
MFSKHSTEKICAFFLEWRQDNSFNMSPSESSGRASRRQHFTIVKPDEDLADLIADNLTAPSSSASLMKFNKSFSSSNRLINKDLFIKDWEVGLLFLNFVSYFLLTNLVQL